MSPEIFSPIKTHLATLIIKPGILSSPILPAASCPHSPPPHPNPASSAPALRGRQSRTQEGGARRTATRRWHLAEAARCPKAHIADPQPPPSWRLGASSGRAGPLRTCHAHPPASHPRPHGTAEGRRPPAPRMPHAAWSHGGRGRERGEHATQGAWPVRGRVWWVRRACAAEAGVCSGGRRGRSASAARRGGRAARAGGEGHG